MSFKINQHVTQTLQFDQYFLISGHPVCLGNIPKSQDKQGNGENELLKREYFFSNIVAAMNIQGKTPVRDIIPFICWVAGSMVHYITAH